MFNDLTSLGYGLVVFAIIIGVGTVVLYNFGGSTACSGAGTFSTWNSTADKCQNSSGSQITPPSQSWSNTNYLSTQLGSTGLAGWTPAIIAISVGLLFLGAFMLRGGGKKGRY